MKWTKLYSAELRRLLHTGCFRVAALLCLLTPLLGKLYPMLLPVLSNKYIAAPLIAAAGAGGILWAVMTILEANRIHRSGIVVLTDAIAAPHALPAARMAAQLTLSAGVALLCMLVWMPYTAYKMEFLFSASFYMLNYAVILLPSWWISMLFAECLYQFTRRTEAAALIYALAVGCCALPSVRFSLSLRWLTPTIITYSDAFPTYWPLRVAAYSRCIWLAIAFSGWLMSLAAVRTYQRGLFSSLLRGLRKPVFPVFAAILTAGAVFMANMQPFSDHGPESIMLDTIEDDISALINSVLTAVQSRFRIIPDMTAGTITGSAEYEIAKMSKRNMEDYSCSISLNCGYTVDSVTMNGTALPYETLHDDHRGQRSTVFTLPEEYEGTLRIEYHGMPTQRRANMPNLVMDIVDPEFLSLYHSSIMPQLNTIRLSEYGTSLSIILPEGLTPYLEYQPFETMEPAGNGLCEWETKPREPKFNLQAGKFKTEQLQAGGVNIDFIYGAIYEDTVRDNDIVGGVKAVFDYCTAHYGELSFNENDTLSLLQSSATIMGGWAGSGWSTWGEYIMTPETLKDAERGASAREVFMHEMIHQWWGGFGVLFTDEDIWTCEGMTVYSTYRLAKELYGEAYAKKYYIDKWKQDVQKQNRNFYNRHPEYLQMLPASLQYTLRENNKSINQYSRMPLMLLKAEELLGGEAQMDALLSQVYSREIQKKLAEGYTEENYYSFRDFLEDCGLKEEELKLDEDYLL